MPELYIGLMSGTSMDGIDAALVEIDSGHIRLLNTHQHPIHHDLKNQLQKLALNEPGTDLDMLGTCDTELGIVFADACIQLLKQSSIKPSAIKAIGSHGQTIRHQPDIQHPFSMQIGDASQIAYRTGITTINDFRRKDIAAGGQGAPLAPAFHQAFFSSPDHNRVILNIGGIANISYLPKDTNQHCTGFDCGPGNTLMDAWIQKKQQKEYDRNGTWAASNDIHQGLLEKLMQDDFIHRPPPKSSGREHYNLGWLNRQLRLFSPIDDGQVQATLCAFTAHSIYYAIQHFLTSVDEIIVCGGGAHNRHLMHLLDGLSGETALRKTDDTGIAADWVEAAAFAWLAHQTLHQLPGNLPDVTGASQAVILGAIHPAG